MFVVAFVATMAMRFGVRAYMVGWTAILWYIYAFLFTGGLETSEIAGSLLLGYGVVVGLHLIGAVVERLRSGQYATGPPETMFDEDPKYIAGYSLTVATVLAVAIWLGLQWLTVDPTWVANGAFFVLGPSTHQSWVKGLERGVATVVGLAAGWALIGFIDTELTLFAVLILLGGFSIAAAPVNYSLFPGTIAAVLVVIWGLGGSEALDFSSFERILAEGLAIALAMAATWFLGWWARTRNVDEYVEFTIG
ncbi:MAG: FUSC family protein [Acidimicrobiia bacterium]